MASSKSRPTVRGLTSSTASRPVKRFDSEAANLQDATTAEQFGGLTSLQDSVVEFRREDSETVTVNDAVPDEQLEVETAKPFDSKTPNPPVVATSVKKTLYFSQDDVDLLDNLQLLERRRRGKRVTLSELVTEAIKDYAERLGVKTS